MAGWREKVKDIWWKLRRNKGAQLIVGISVLVLVLAVIFGILVYLGKVPGFKRNSSSVNTFNQLSTPAIEAVGARRLDGVEVPTSEVNLFPIAVMIENLAKIRPQAGLSQANLIYEAPVEGGITRLLALYANHDVIQKIGPIRSARHYFVDWAEEYHGLYSYVGGSPQALGITGSSNFIVDLNQFYNAGYYYRDSAIVAPHNVFSSSELYAFALRDLGLTDKAGDYQPYLFKENSIKADRPNVVESIIIDFSSQDYQVEWRYQSATNSYLRWNGDQPHTDQNNGQQLEARNIIVQKVTSQVLDEATGRLDIVTEGSGEAILFQDGQAEVGQWQKQERGVRTRYITQSGSNFKFNPGVTWIEVVPSDNSVTY